MWVNYSGETVSVTPGVVHLWRASLCVTQYLASYEQQLPEDEKARGRRFIKPDDQKKFFMSRKILRDILAYYTKISPERISFSTGKNGKPYLAEMPIQFNLSHSGDCLLIAVTAENEIGVDVEYVRKTQDFLALSQRFFARSEYEAILEYPSEDEKIAAFYQCWTRKEAFIKATGLGLSFGLSDFEVSVDHQVDKKSALLSIKNDDVESKNWSLLSVDMTDFSEKYYAAFAIQKAVTSLFCWNFK